jgi:hypothetical protein
VDPSLLSGKFFQAGYIVRDLDQGLAAMSARAGVANWRVVRLPAGSPIDGIACAYVNGVMLELIAVDDGNVPQVYRNHIPHFADGARFHHLGFMMASEEEFNAAIERSQAAGIGEAAKFDNRGVLSYYADSFAQVGHYCEYVHLKPERQDYFANVPHN